MCISYDSLIETLTFLFTDIEGSTALLRRLGDDVYAQVLAEHHRLIRASLDVHGGHEEGTQGDAFFATFTSPRACVQSAIEIQIALDQHEWPGDEQLRVRMGIHTGEVAEASTGLVGYEVHRAARIAAVGYGGQVLLSSAAAGLVEDSLDTDVALRDLGPHRLKDLGRPEVLFQLDIEGLASNFPTLRSLDNPELPNNLPASLSPFVGRHVELEEVRALILESRLVTLTGSGGSGKTRLALQTAAELLDGSGEGVWFVALAPVSDPEQVPATVIDALQIRQDGNREPLDALVNALRDQRVLIVLDNCEHVVDHVAKMVDLIGRSCPKVRLVATSREPLGVDGEQVYRVRSLSLPDGEVLGVADLDGFDAIDLFVARGRLQDSKFQLDDANAAVVASICRRLDGIPLALELAAARLSSMSLGDISRRLDQRFRLLTGGSRNALPRQQTLGAMVAWSYDLLTEQERDVLRRLSVFVNGFDLDAAEAVCASEVVDSFDIAGILGSLVNKNLVDAERADDTLRYRLLETIRQYAAEQLLQINGEEIALDVRHAHAEHYLEWCERIAPELIHAPTKLTRMQEVTVEWDNIKASFDTFAEEHNGTEQLVRLIVAVCPFADARFLPEPFIHLERVLAESVDLSPQLRLESLFWRAQGREIILRINELSDVNREQRREQLKAVIELAIENGNVHMHVLGLSFLALTVKQFDGKEQAAALAQEAIDLARPTGDDYLIGFGLISLGLVQSDVGQGTEENLGNLREAAQCFKRAGDPVGFAMTLQVIGVTAWGDLDDVRASLPMLEESTIMAEHIGITFLMFLGWMNLAVAYCLGGDIDRADYFARRSLMLGRRLGLPNWQATFNVATIACCALAGGDYVRAARLTGAFETLSLDMPEGSGWSWSPLEQRAREENTSAIVAALGSETFDQEFAIGQHFNFEEVSNLALNRVSA